VICRDQVLRRPTGFGPFDHLRTHRDELGPSPAAHVGPYYSMSFTIGTKIIGILRARPAVIRRPVLKWPPTGRPQGGMWVSRISPRSSRRRESSTGATLSNGRRPFIRRVPQELTSRYFCFTSMLTGHGWPAGGRRLRWRTP
jgi:hypothetical protein